MMTSHAGTGKDIALNDIDRAIRRFGGRFFVAALVLAALFTALLIDLRFAKIFSFPLDVANASKEDLMAFWRAGVMSVQGDAAALYDSDRFRAGLPPNGAGLLWLNPPHFLLLVTPLGLLPYGAAKAIWLALSVAAFAALARLAGRGHPFAWLILLSPAMFAHLLVIQAGPFVALGLFCALSLARRRPIAAGILLALLTMKPQFGLIAPVFFAATGQWRAIVATITTSFGLVLLSIAFFGIDPWMAFVQSLGGAHSQHAATLHVDMLTIHQTVGKLGFDPTWRSIGQFAVTGAAALVVWVSARRLPQNLAIGVTLLASAAASPSLWVYDWPLIAAGLIVLCRGEAPWPLPLQALAASLWAAPLISLGFGTKESSLVAPSLLLLSTVAATTYLIAVKADDRRPQTR